MFFLLVCIQVSKRIPNDAEAKSKYNECNKIVKRLAFEKAISSDVEEKTLAELHSDLELIGKNTISIPSIWYSFQ